MAAIVAWAAEQKDTPQRSEAIRRLVEIGLKREVTERSTKKPGQKARPQQLAARAIDEMQDPSTPPQERPQRRRRLTKGPFEFRGDRVDRPKASEK